MKSQKIHEVFTEGREGCVPANGKLAPAASRSYQDKNHSVRWAQENERLSLSRSRTAVFGHEVANSLTVISSSLQFVEMELEKKQANDPALIAIIQSAVGEINRLDSLLNEFRSPARFQTCNLISTDLVKVVEEVLALETLVCRAGGIIVKFEFEDAVPRVRLDAAKIKQVILNLCKNAVEAMSQGGCLTLKVYQSGPTVVLEISDNGIGMPESVNIFELFKSTKPGGSGVGLSVVQQIVSTHSGTIACTSEAGRGTTFKIVFPIAD
jgi:signal transduction histidine kinase